MISPAWESAKKEIAIVTRSLAAQNRDQGRRGNSAFSRRRHIISSISAIFSKDPECRIQSPPGIPPPGDEHTNYQISGRRRRRRRRRQCKRQIHRSKVFSIDSLISDIGYALHASQYCICGPAIYPGECPNRRKRIFKQQREYSNIFKRRKGSGLCLIRPIPRRRNL